MAGSTLARAQCISFSGEAEYTFNSVGAIAAGDFNGDGQIDLAIASTSSNNTTVPALRILLGQGNGSFSQVAEYPFNAVRSIAAGDFNGDGLVDLAIGSTSSNNTTVPALRILLGQGNGGFSQVAEYPFNAVRSIAAGDFNGDGRIDLAIGSSWSNNTTVPALRILQGQGNGGFSQVAEYPFNAVGSITAGDFSGDGLIDLAIGSTWSNNTTVPAVRILLGQGNGGFFHVAEYPFNAVNSVCAGSFHGGGRIDLALGTTWSNNTTVPALRILANTGSIGIVSQPAGNSMCLHGTVTFSVSAVGFGPITYQWRQGGALIDTAANPSAATATLTLADIQPADAAGGSYDCIVTGPCGSVTSNPASLTITAACNPADLVSIGGGTTPNGNTCPDGLLTGDDFNAFIAAFADEAPLADIVSIGGEPPPDGLVTGDDFNAFISAFANGCP